MSPDSKKMKPKTDFQLVLNYAKQHVWKKLKNDSGAGANAACRIDKTYSASDPISEIIWTPDQGLCLKCLDSSFSNKNTSLFEDVGPSSMVLALLQSVTEDNSTTDKPKDDAFVQPFTVICTKSDVSSVDAPSIHPTSDSVVLIPDYKASEEHDTGSGDNMEKMNTSSGTPTLLNGQENLMNYSEKNTCAHANIETTIISEIMEKKSSTISGQVDQRPVGNLLLPEAEPKPSMEQNSSPRKHCNEGMDTDVNNQVVEIEDGLYTKIEQIFEYKGSDALGTNLISSSISLSKKMESTAKNDFQTFNLEATSAATSRALVSKSNDNKNKSLVNYTIQMTRNKDKQKLLLDGDPNARKEENDSHSSCESCHSTELFLAGKKRCKQEVVLGSKRIKKQIQETSCSKYFVKRNSSFMNLISNMMKGYSQSSQEEENQDPELKNAGFKSNFQSMNCPSLKDVGTKMSHQVGAASKEFELGKKEHGIDATPITCYAENNSLCRQYMQSNKFGISKGRHDVSPSLHPQIKPVDVLNSHEHWQNNSVENENSDNWGLGDKKEGMTFQSPSSRQNKINNDNVESWALYERKEICHKSDTLGDWWIQRFSPKSTSPLLIFDHLNERGGSEAHFTCCSMLPHSRKQNSHLNTCKVEETREQSGDDQLLSKAKSLQNCCINEDDSSGHDDDQGNIDQSSKHKFNPIAPFPGLRASKPMVSMFARRLGAIKQCQQTL